MAKNRKDSDVTKTQKEDTLYGVPESMKKHLTKLQVRTIGTLNLQAPNWKDSSPQGRCHFLWRASTSCLPSSRQKFGPWRQLLTSEGNRKEEGGHSWVLLCSHGSVGEIYRLPHQPLLEGSMVFHHERDSGVLRCYLPSLGEGPCCAWENQVEDKAKRGKPY